MYFSHFKPVLACNVARSMIRVRESINAQNYVQKEIQKDFYKLKLDATFQDYLTFRFLSGKRIRIPFMKKLGAE